MIVSMARYIGVFASRCAFTQEPISTMKLIDSVVRSPSETEVIFWQPVAVFEFCTVHRSSTSSKLHGFPMGRVVLRSEVPKLGDRSTTALRKNYSVDHGVDLVGVAMTKWVVF